MQSRFSGSPDERKNRRAFRQSGLSANDDNQAVMRNLSCEFQKIVPIASDQDYLMLRCVFKNRGIFGVHRKNLS